MRQDLAVRLRMVYTRGEGKQVFVSYVWRRLFRIRAPLVREFILEFLSTCRMSDTKMGLDVADTLCFQLGGVKRRMTWTQFILALGLHTEQEMTKVGFGAYWDGSDRLIPDKGDLRDYWIEISFDKDFWARTGEAPEKVTSVDTLYLLTWSEGLLTSQHLISAVSLFRHDEREDMQGQLGRLNICSMFGDTLAWVAPGPERQQVTAAGAHEADEAGPTVDEGA
ncbi:hypothetical protein Tco_1466957 [Tanacetum coccineum]